jgi:alkyl sulfatase BDS1-like metallo-beta-lactamase superfamily hydrolase
MRIFQPIQRFTLSLFAVWTSVVLLGSAATAQTSAPNPTRPAEPATVRANAAFAATLPWTDRQAFEDARRGFVAALPDALVPGEGPRPVWSMKPYAFLLADKVPDTVNPSLWRQAQLNAIHGLFKVTDGIYQVRGMDLANMTIVEGDTGLIVIDPLLTTQTARAALDLYLAHRPFKPVVAVIYTHSHGDHFGGVKGVTSDADVASGKVRVIAPEGFLDHAVAENIIAGNAMSRRAHYQFGTLLPPGERGHVDTGLGKALSRGSFTLIPPTDSVTPRNLQQRIDGVDIEFFLAPGSEAPAELMMYFPRQRVLNTAEVTSQHMHNVYTIRGAEVRDASLWSRYIAQVRERYAARSDVLIAQHHWPVWSSQRITRYLGLHRDLYKYIHDQSVRLLNHGYLPGDIAEALKLPAALESEWSTRGYYGTLRHNARAIYQKYLGWYDANPAHLNPLPPQAGARKAIDYMGGVAKVLERARADYANGEYRWVASVMSQAVWADPGNAEARALAADALEQLGYQAEAGTWRGAYLTGAQELRQGPPKIGVPGTLTPDTLKALSTELFFDFMAVRLNGPKADGKRVVTRWDFTDLQQSYVLNLENATLTYLPVAPATPIAPGDALDARLTLSRATLDQILLRQLSFPAAVQSGAIRVQGDSAKLFEVLQLLDEFAPTFAIVEPVR